VKGLPANDPVSLYIPCSVLPVDVLVLRLPQHDPASDGAVLRRDRDSGRRHARGRLAVFGYAHLLFFKNHQRLIDEAALPDSNARAEQVAAVAETLVAACYREIGLTISPCQKTS